MKRKCESCNRLSTMGVFGLDGFIKKKLRLACSRGCSTDNKETPQGKMSHFQTDRDEKSNGKRKEYVRLTTRPSEVKECQEKRAIARQHVDAACCHSSQKWPRDYSFHTIDISTAKTGSISHIRELSGGFAKESKMLPAPVVPRLFVTRITNAAQSLGQSRIIKKSHETHSDTLYVNWSNTRVPGMGWLGTFPEPAELIDDTDEINLFRRSNISHYLRPDHPQFMSPQSSKFTYIPSVTMYANSTTTESKCTSRKFAVVTIPVVPFDGEPETRAELQDRFEAVQYCCRQFGVKSLVLPLGRFYRCNYEPLVIA